MERVSLDKDKHCLDIFGSPGQLVVHLDSDTPIRLTFCHKVKIYFDLWDNSQAWAATNESKTSGSHTVGESSPTSCWSIIGCIVPDNTLPSASLSQSTSGPPVHADDRCLVTFKSEAVEKGGNSDLDGRNESTPEASLIGTEPCDIPPPIDQSLSEFRGCGESVLSTAVESVSLAGNNNTIVSKSVDKGQLPHEEQANKVKSKPGATSNYKGETVYNLLKAKRLRQGYKDGASELGLREDYTDGASELGSNVKLGSRQGNTDSASELGSNVKLGSRQGNTDGASELGSKQGNTDGASELGSSVKLGSRQGNTDVAPEIGSDVKLWPMCRLSKNDWTKQQKVVKVMKLKKSAQGEKVANCEDIKFICVFCKQCFPGEVHLLAHHRVLESIRRCELCGEDFLCEADLFTHRLKDHSQEPFSSFYPSLKLLAQNKREKHKCRLCGKILANAAGLQNHIQASHFCDKTYKCCLCGEAKHQYWLLLDHLRTRHADKLTGPIVGNLRKISVVISKKSKSKASKFSSESDEESGSEQEDMSENTKSSFEGELNDNFSETCREINKVSKLKRKASAFPVLKQKTQYTLSACRYCGKKFKSFLAKKEHIKGSVDEVPCPKCHLVFPTQADFIIHDARDHAISNEETLITDITKFHDANHTPCPVCSKLYLNSSLVDHICEAHTKELQFSCCICKQLFFSRKKLYTHLRSHTDPDKNGRRTGVFRCSQCPQVFKDKGEFSKHAHSHRTTCAFCKKDFGHILLLETHYQSVHAHEMLTCEECGKQLATEMQMYHHKRHHRYSKLNPCPVCGIMLRRTLTTHLKDVHPEYSGEKVESSPQHSANDWPEKMNSLELFSNNFTTDSNGLRVEGGSLSEPVPTTPTESVSHPYLCSRCPKTFATNNRLKAHLRMHEEEGMLHRCPQCQKTYSSKVNLARHINSVHIKSKLYTCEVCNKVCTRKSNLRIHMRTHSLVKFFFCKVCNQGFNYKASLQSHMKSKHNCVLTD